MTSTARVEDAFLYLWLERANCQFALPTESEIMTKFVSRVAQAVCLTYHVMQHWVKLDGRLQLATYFYISTAKASAILKPEPCRVRLRPALKASRMLVVLTNSTPLALGGAMKSLDQRQSHLRPAEGVSGIRIGENLFLHTARDTVAHLISQTGLSAVVLQQCEAVPAMTIC